MRNPETGLFDWTMEIHDHVYNYNIDGKGNGGWEYVLIYPNGRPFGSNVAESELRLPRNR